MRFRKSVKLAANILIHSKLRSWLTIIGIVIGVAAVVAIVSIGQGLQQNVSSRLGGLGADVITVSPGGGRAAGGFRVGGGGGGENAVAGKNLTQKDILIIKNTPGVKYVEGTVNGRGSVYYLSELATLGVKGVDTSTYPLVTTSVLASGRFFNPSEAGSVIIGYNIAQKTFKEPLEINRLITIENKPFKIIGTLQQSAGFGGDDNNIIMSVDDARNTLQDMGHDNFNSILVKVNDANLVQNISDDIQSRLMISRHVMASKLDFSVSSAASTQSQLSSITSTLTIFLAAIAAVSLIVGAVGIANTMFTSVLEKTKEIGIMKAIGAKNSDIMTIFLLNSGMVGFVGGLLGIILGSGISILLPDLGVRLLPGSGSLSTAITPSLLIYSMLLSIAIGMIAGAIPAYRASKLKPADALRYE